MRGSCTYFTLWLLEIPYPTPNPKITGPKTMLKQILGGGKATMKAQPNPAH